MGSDRRYASHSILGWNFNPRCPSGQRQNRMLKHRFQCKFQSTLPKWAATTPLRPCSTMPPISIHAAQVGSDRFQRQRLRQFLHFNPRCPSGQRQWQTEKDVQYPVISIHAAQVGSDCAVPPGVTVTEDFNPRCPSGQRPIMV